MILNGKEASICLLSTCKLSYFLSLLTSPSNIVVCINTKLRKSNNSCSCLASGQYLHTRELDGKLCIATHGLYYVSVYLPYFQP